jgi:GTP-binding protein
VFFADLTAPDRNPRADAEILRAELDAFDEELAARPSLVVASKVDAGRDRLGEVLDAYPDALPISAVTGEGIQELVGRLSELVAVARSRTPAAGGYVRHVVRDEPITVTREGPAWRVKGRRVERAVSTTDLDNAEATTRLQRRLISMGVERLLIVAGARSGDEVRIGDAAFEFEPEESPA